MALRSTTARFLISDPPLKATEHIPVIPLVCISLKTFLADYYSNLLDKVPQSRDERLLWRALKNMIDQEKDLKSWVILLQASLVLLQKYCDRVRGQLEAHWKKRKLKGQ